MLSFMGESLPRLSARRRNYAHGEITFGARLLCACASPTGDIPNNTGPPVRLPGPGASGSRGQLAGKIKKCPGDRAKDHEVDSPDSVSHSRKIDLSENGPGPASYVQAIKLVEGGAELVQ
jgi:hypothetical protein